MKQPIAIVFFLLLGGTTATFFRTSSKCNSKVPLHLAIRGGESSQSTFPTNRNSSKEKILQISRGGGEHGTATGTNGMDAETPLLRGEFHRIGAICYPPLLGLPLFLRSTPNNKRASLMFSLAVEGIMVVSATLHTFPWQRHQHEFWYMFARKADFAMIFVGIALFYSSVVKLLLGGAALFTNVIEPLVWSCAAVGVVAKCFFPDSPPWFNAAVFLVQGWAIAPLIPLMFRIASIPEAVCLVLGGIFITLGATAYSIRWPDGHWRFHPDVFGPHEMFHIGTLLMFVSFWCTMWMRVVR